MKAIKLSLSLAATSAILSVSTVLSAPTTGHGYHLSKMSADQICKEIGCQIITEREENRMGAQVMAQYMRTNRHSLLQVIRHRQGTIGETHITLQGNLNPGQSLSKTQVEEANTFFKSAIGKSFSASEIQTCVQSAHKRRMANKTASAGLGLHNKKSLATCDLVRSKTPGKLNIIFGAELLSS